MNANWVGAGHLKIGDKIKQADGTTGVVANVVTVEQTQEMFNLTVDEAHTFYVGQNGWLVHNADGSCGLTYLGARNAGTAQEVNIFSYGGKEIRLGTGHAWDQSKHLLDGTGLTPGQVEQAIVQNLGASIYRGVEIGTPATGKTIQKFFMTTKSGETIPIQYSAVRLPNGSYSVSTYYVPKGLGK